MVARYRGPPGRTSFFPCPPQRRNKPGQFPDRYFAGAAPYSPCTSAPPPPLMPPSAAAARQSAPRRDCRRRADFAELLQEFSLIAVVETQIARAHVGEQRRIIKAAVGVGARRARHHAHIHIADLVIGRNGGWISAPRVGYLGVENIRGLYCCVGIGKIVTEFQRDYMLGYRHRRQGIHLPHEAEISRAGGIERERIPLRIEWLDVIGDHEQPV